MTVNQATLLGNVGKDPEIRKANNGKEIASFSLATTESWKNKESGNRETKTEWLNIVVFQEGLVSTIKKYVKKGTKLYIQGQIKTRKWTDKSGVDKWTTEIVLSNFSSVLKVIGAKDIVDSGKKEEVKSNEFVANEELDDDIPF